MLLRGARSNPVLKGAAHTLCGSEVLHAGETLLEAPLFDGYAEDPTLFVGPTGVLHMLAHGELRSAGATGVAATSAPGATSAIAVVPSSAAHRDAAPTTPAASAVRAATSASLRSTHVRAGVARKVRSGLLVCRVLMPQGA